MGQSLPEQITLLARPLTEQAGLDLVDVEVKGSGPRTRVRVIVDRKGGVDLDACRTLSLALGRALDEVDPTSGRYTLEVTSPGTDRPLEGQRAFDRVQGRTVRALVGDGESPREVRGEVLQAGPESVVLRDADGVEHELAYHEISKATQVLPW